MPIYCEPHSDEKILSEIEGDEKVLFVGCGSCANISYNLYNGGEKPAYNLRKKPLSILEEISRLESVLTERESESMVINGLCVNSPGRTQKIRRMAKNCDEIIVLSCKAGLGTVESALTDKKITNGMRIRGFKSLTLKRKGTKIYIEQQNEKDGSD